MLYKPTNPSPYNATVDYNMSDLSFTVSCISTTDITNVRLAIKDNASEHYLAIKDNANPLGKTYLEQCILSSKIQLPPNSNTLDTIIDFTGGNPPNSYRIATNNYARTSLVKAGITSMDDIIKPLMSYRWQLRLYEKNCNTNIGYGFVQNVYTADSNIRYSEKSTHILKIRPHTNMFWNIETNTDKGNNEDDFNSFSNVSGLNSTQKNMLKNQLTSYWDKNVHYEIEIGGIRAEVVAYYYGNKKNSNTALPVQTDSYGQPLFAYVEVKADSNLSVSEGDEYSIYTNYIDSNEYYFSCRQLSEVKFRGRDGSPINEFTSIDELDANPDDHIYSPTHSNVQIKGSFDSKSSVAINYYRATLYQVLSNGEDTQIHDSGYVYGSEINYDCKDLLSGNKYKLVINVTDTYGNTVSKGVYIKPNCGAVVKSTMLTVEPYKEHGSIVLDFSKLVSITGVESNPSDDSYQTGKLVSEYNDETDLYEGTTETFGFFDLAGLCRTEGYICHINQGNSVTWSKYDGQDKYISCASPIINATFRCSDGLDNQTIFELSQRGYTYTLTWEVYQFHLRIDRTYTQYSPKTVYVLENGSFVQKKIQEEVILTENIIDDTYNPYENIDVNAIHTAMRNQAANYSVPYLAYEDMPLEETLYMHTEGVAKDCWWQVIVSDGYWYMKCIYSPIGLSLENEAYYITQHSGDVESVAAFTLYGGCTYCNVSVNEFGSNADNTIDLLKANPLKDLAWGDDTVFQINFCKGLSGGNFNGGFADSQYADVHHFRVYQKHSNQPQLHKVYETSSADENIVEVFTVGCKCPYKYYIVPVCYDNNGAETIGSIMESEPIELDDGIVRVIGLVQDPEDLDTFYVDANNVWHFALNMSNNGFQNNMGKTYNDTPQKYPVEIKNKGFYRSFNISGLLGKFDCDEMDYVDTYDDIIEWENFVNNGEMKLIIDLRGIMTIGTMESNNIEYDEFGAHSVSADFSIRQLENIDRVTVINRSLLINPNDTTQQLLYDSDDLALQDGDDKYLIVPTKSEGDE